MKYFADCKTAEDAKALYRELAKKYHPDLHPGENTEEMMKAINNEFERAWERLKDVHTSKDGGTYEAQGERRTHETAAEFMGIIVALLSLDGVTVELCGRWIWVSGNTLPHKNRLSALGCKWASAKKMWSWHKVEDATASRGKYSIDQIRDFYGSQVCERQEESRLALA